MRRRDVMRGAAAMGIAGSLPPQRPDQMLQPLSRAGSGPSPQSPVIVARIIIVRGSPGGVFIYDASGNLVDSMAFQASIDPLTHSNVTGIANQGPVAAVFRQVQINAGVVNFNSSGVSLAGPWSGIGTIGLQQFSGGGSALQVLTETGGFVMGGSPSAGGLFFVPPSGDVTGGTDTGVLRAAFNVGLTPVLLPSTYYINCGDSVLTALGPGQFIIGSGINSTFINALGSGDLFGWSFSGTYSSRTTVGGGILNGCTIDMVSAGVSSTAIHAGDIESLQFQNVYVVNSGGAGSATQTAFHFDNRNHFTERLTGDLHWFNIPGVIFDVSGAVTSTNSFDRCDIRCWITQNNPIFDGVVLQNGAVLLDGSLALRGNFNSSGSAVTSCALRVTGTVPAGHPGAGSFSQVNRSRLDIGVECPAGAFTPQTIIFGAGSNVITDSYGVMDFGNNFSAATWTGSGSFFGPIAGDSTLAALARLARPLKLDVGLSVLHGNSQALVNGSTITTAGFTGTLTTGVGAGVTGIIMQAGTLDGQLMTVINQSGAGTITFAAAATSNVADGVADVIAAQTARTFIWSTSTSLWYRCS